MARRSRKGFALLDILVALFVLVVLMLPCCELLIGGRRLEQQAEIQALAYQVARQELENLRTLKYGNRTVTTSTPFAIPPSALTQFPQQNLAGTYSISSYGAYASPPVQQIVVQVTWNRYGADTATSSVQVDTLDAQEPGR